MTGHEDEVVRKRPARAGAADGLAARAFVVLMFLITIAKIGVNW
jgi:hypothetical protein